LGRLPARIGFTADVEFVQFGVDRVDNDDMSIAFAFALNDVELFAVERPIFDGGIVGQG